MSKTEVYKCDSCGKEEKAVVFEPENWLLLSISVGGMPKFGLLSPDKRKAFGSYCSVACLIQALESWQRDNPAQK